MKFSICYNIHNVCEQIYTSIVDCLVVQLQNSEADSEYAVNIELDPIQLQPRVTQSLVHMAPFWLHRVALNSEAVSLKVTYKKAK
jgi:hypothetical protein